MPGSVLTKEDKQKLERWTKKVHKITKEHGLCGHSDVWLSVCNKARKISITWDDALDDLYDHVKQGGDLDDW